LIPKNAKNKPKIAALLLGDAKVGERVAGSEKFL
jgi:hypothetical protein